MLKINFYIKCFLIVVPKFINKLFLKKNIKNELVLSTRYPKELIYFLKVNSMIDASCLVDICVIDNLNLIQRFEINYNLLSIKHNFRYFLKTYTNLQM
jgi:NADH:ubiquinone oxidoreductase subunit C